MNRIINLFIFSTLIYPVYLQECSSEFIRLCKGQKTCDECIRQHTCCSFCYDTVVDSQFGERCSTEEDLRNRNCYNIESVPESETVTVRNESFRDVTNSETYAVQIKPQHFKIKLRKGEPQNITITYRPAKDHRVDLYYLLDLSISMRSFMDTIKALGANLIDHMTNMTKNYRLGFGSYLDKPIMPYYRTDDEHFTNPCRGEDMDKCGPGYLFKHHLNFSSDSNLFVKEVDKRSVSANLDKLEGGLEGLMQLLLCQAETGWGEDSRKFILLVTDAPLHFAGEGILGGAVKRNIDKCLLDPEGNYGGFQLYDYPSLSEIRTQLAKYKTNVIIATTEDSKYFYSEMSKILPDQIYVGLLKKDSSNILKLIEDGYKSLYKKAVIITKTANVEDKNLLDIKMMVDCDHSWNYIDGNTCDNMVEGKRMNVRLQIGINQFIRDRNITLYIEERNIKEKVTVEIEAVGSYCNCALENIARSSKRKCINGEYRCNSCICNEGWKGVACDENCIDDIDQCRLRENGSISVSCFGHGDCVCGKCLCDFPFQGQYCRYACPVDEDNNICSNHGTCIDGICKCDALYIKEDCSYSTDTTNCLIPGTNIICNNHGDCDNNQCICHEGYYGTHCEECESCNALCDYYKDCVISALENEQDSCVVGNITVEVFKTDSSDGFICNIPHKRNDTKCEVTYIYDIKGEEVKIRMKEQCSQSLQAAAIKVSLITLAVTILLGVIGILIYICYIRIQDKRELAKFEENQKKSKFMVDENPLYKSPITKYENIQLTNRESSTSSQM